VVYFGANNHRDTENTEVAQRNQTRHYLIKIEND
jgi:hypothetical protein